MNIKLHTPKSLKSGSGISSIKQFLLSLFATTVSIALTFGTAAIIDYNKKQREKHEIVMMVMYDMYNSLAPVQEADSMIRKLIEIQNSIIADTTKYNMQTSIRMYTMLPKIEFTSTTENIFSSNIETINTVGNVLFTESVAQFYQARRNFKTQVCDSLTNEAQNNYIFNSAKSIVDLFMFDIAIKSYDLKYDMEHLFTQCKEMMNVSDDDLEAYRRERAQWEKDFADKNSIIDSYAEKLIEQEQRARETLKTK